MASGKVIYVCKPLPSAARGWDDSWRALGRIEWNQYRYARQVSEEEAEAPDARVLPFRPSGRALGGER